MKYNLLHNSKGYLDNRDTVFWDGAGDTEIILEWTDDAPTLKVFATITTAKQRRLSVEVVDSKFILPKNLLIDEQIKIVVSCTSNGEVIKLWELEPLRTSELLKQIEPLYKVEPALIEVTQSELILHTNQIIQQDIKLNNLMQKFEALKEKHSQILAQNAILADALQTLTKQVYLIEQKYSIIETVGGKN